MKMTLSNVRWLIKSTVALSLPLALSPSLTATENVPHAPFAQWADVPESGQLIVGAIYQESESYHIWANGGQRYNINSQSGGENYGIDINQGYLAFQYGITPKWAGDLSIGGTTTGWREFSNGGTNGSIRSTIGMMDFAFGVRYQIFNEAESNAPSWQPTLTFRAGAVLPGTYSQNFPFAPGNSVCGD